MKEDALRRWNVARPCLILSWWIGATLVVTCGCLPMGLGEPDVRVIGRQGLDDGRFIKPRAMVSDDRGRLYVVDKTGRIQLFDERGNFVRGWRIPEVVQGKPVGMGVSQDGRLMVCDTHYFRVLFYDENGTLDTDRTLGGVNGRGPGEFGFVTDVVQDSSGNYYVGEYGDFDRVQKFTPDGEFVYQFGGHGQQPGQFLRPQGLLMDNEDQLWIADACNHRIQVFDVSGDQPKFVTQWGQQGSEVGQLSYPYGIEFDDQGNLLVCEFGNHRVQRFTRQGQSLGTWGGPGRQPGQLQQPWAIARGPRDSWYVADTYNHRLQQFRFRNSPSND